MLIVISAEVRKLYDLRRDGKFIYRGTQDECFMKLQRIQGQSAQWAMTYEGYKIVPVEFETIEDWPTELPPNDSNDMSDIDDDRR